MSNNWTVSKFGGSSLCDAFAIKRCVDIICNDINHKVVVVSAIQNTTNQLESMAQLAIDSKQQSLAQWHDIYDHHLGIASELGILTEFKIDLKAKQTLNLIGKSEQITDMVMDEVYSWGERMSSLIMATYLDVPCLDARIVLKTDHQHRAATPLVRETRQAASKVLLPQIWGSGDCVVTQGFVGGTLNGKTTTLGREGSDYSGALFAEAIRAAKCNIWTDVPGVATGDPKRVSNPCYIPTLSYKNATLMAHSGANVLFPRTLEPADRANISVHVRSSLNPDKPGTVIQRNSHNQPRPLAVTSTKQNNDSLVSIIGHQLLDLFQFSPEKHLSRQLIQYELKQQETDRFSFIVPQQQTDAALSTLHKYLIKYNESSRLARIQPRRALAG